MSEELRAGDVVEWRYTRDRSRRLGLVLKVNDDGTVRVHPLEYTVDVTTRAALGWIDRPASDVRRLLEAVVYQRMLHTIMEQRGKW